MDCCIYFYIFFKKQKQEDNKNLFSFFVCSFLVSNETKCFFFSVTYIYCNTHFFFFFLDIIF